MRKKVILLTVCLILLTGCGGNATESTQEPGDSTVVQNSEINTEQQSEMIETETADSQIAEGETEIEDETNSETESEISSENEKVEGTQECKHTYSKATCTEPAKCSECGETQGKALGHEVKEADCTHEATCTRCGKSVGGANGHDYMAATCTEPETCSVCGETKGSAIGHNYSAATCEEPQKCKNCSVTIGKELGYDYLNGECTRCKEKNPNYKEIEITLDNWEQFFEVNYGNEEWTKNNWDEYVSYELFAKFQLKDKYQGCSVNVMYEMQYGYFSYDYKIDFNNKTIELLGLHGDGTIYYRTTENLSSAVSLLGGKIERDSIMQLEGEPEGVGTNYLDSALTIICEIEVIRIKGTIVIEE